jgi:integrase
MQAKGYLHGSVLLSTDLKGQPRKHPIWVLRYRLPSGKDSRKTLGRAWTKASRPPRGFITESQARVAAQRFLDAHADSVPDERRTFDQAATDFIAYCKRERGLRESTLHEYRRMVERLCERPWRGDHTWRTQLLDAFTEDDILALRGELIDAGRSPDTLNHHRRVLRGIFGTGGRSVALAWDWMAIRPESEGQLQFYTPAQVNALKRAARTALDAAIFTLAVEAGPRMSEIRALKVRNVDFEVGVIRFEDGYTTTGGHAGNKGRRVRSVPMTENVRAALWPYCKDRPGDALVFEHDGKLGEPICGTNLYRRFVSAARRAGLPILRFHDLRHSFGTQAIRRVNIYELQRLMGHRNITTTERYLHYAPDADLAARLTGLWGGDQDAENVVPLRQAG